MITVNIPEYGGTKTLTFNETDYRSLFGVWYREVLSLYTTKLSDKEIDAILKYAYPDPNKLVTALVSYAAYGDLIHEKIDYRTFRYDNLIFTNEPSSFVQLLLDSDLSTDTNTVVTLLSEKEVSQKFEEINSLSIDSITSEALEFLDTLLYYSNGDEKDSCLDLVLRPYRENDSVNRDEIVLEKYGAKWRFDVRRAYIESRIDAENMLR